MTSEITALHEAYCSSAGLDLRLNASSERAWFNAVKWGVTPDDVRLVVKWRLRENAQQNGHWSLLIHRLAGDDDALAVFCNQAAMAQAELRKPRMDPGKVVVLEATGRSGEIASPPARAAKDVLIKGLENLKRAVNEI